MFFWQTNMIVLKNTIVGINSKSLCKLITLGILEFKINWMYPNFDKDAFKQGCDKVTAVSF